MSAPNQGRQSPPPETQTGAQQQAPPSNAKGVDDDSNNQEESKRQLEVWKFKNYFKFEDIYWSMYIRNSHPTQKDRSMIM